MTKKKSAFDAEIENKEIQKEEKKRAERGQKEKLEKLKKEFEEQKKTAMENLEESLSKWVRESLETNFEKQQKDNIFSKSLKGRERGQKLLRNKFLAEKFLEKKQYDFDAYLTDKKL